MPTSQSCTCFSKVNVSNAINKLREEALITHLPTQNLVENDSTFTPEVAIGVVPLIKNI